LTPATIFRQEEQEMNSRNEGALQRRTVMKAGGAAAAGALLAGCVIQQPPAAAPPPSATEPATQPPPASGTKNPAPKKPAPKKPAGPPALVKLDDVPVGGGVVLGDQKVVVTRDKSGKASAFSAVCTHQGCLVASVAAGTIDCPCHGSKFDAGTGEPVAGPAQSPLPRVEIQQRDGAVFRA
jgi:Rieske Fe-S protein